MSVQAPTSMQPPSALPGLLVIAGAGLALRLWNIDLTAFNIDEAWLCIKSTRAAFLENVPLTGLRTSFGFHNPPLLVYLLAPAFRVSQGPVLAMGLLAVLGSCASILAGLAAAHVAAHCGQRDKQRAAALSVALVVALCANALDHSRRLWGHDTILFWSALALFGLARSVHDRDWRWLLLAALGAAGAQACHLSGALLWVLFAWAWRFHPRPPLRAALLAPAVLLVIYLPWLVYVATDDPGQIELLNPLNEQTGSTKGERPSPVATPLAWVLVLADSGHNDHLGATWPKGEPLVAAAWGAARAASLLAVAGIVALLGWTALRGGDERRRAWGLGLLLAGAGPLVAFGLAPFPDVPAYQLPALVPLAAGLAIVALDRPRLALWAAAALAITGAASHAASLRAIAGATDRPHNLAVLRFKDEALYEVVKEAQGGPAYAIMQANQPRLDFWVLVLHFAHTGESMSPDDPEAPVLFVFHDTAPTAPTDQDAFLAAQPGEAFGPLRVARLAPREAEAFRSLRR